MSRSYRKPFYKQSQKRECGIKRKKLYRRILRRKLNRDELLVSNKAVSVYEWCDWRWLSDDPKAVRK